MESGKFYLFSAPWFWTFVGRFERYVNFQEIEIADALYFTRTGATFDILCSKGMQRDSTYHVQAGKVLIPASSIKFEWKAPTPWVKK